MLKKLWTKKLLNVLLFAWSGVFTVLVFHTFAVAHSSSDRPNQSQAIQPSNQPVNQPATQPANQNANQPATQPANPTSDRQPESGY